MHQLLTRCINSFKMLPNVDRSTHSKCYRNWPILFGPGGHWNEPSRKARIHEGHLRLVSRSQEEGEEADPRRILQGLRVSSQERDPLAQRAGAEPCPRHAQGQPGQHGLRPASPEDSGGILESDWLPVVAAVEEGPANLAAVDSPGTLDDARRRAPIALD